MRGVIIEPHYLGSLEYYTICYQAEEIVLEVNQRFTKQTYKNRCYVNTASGPFGLTVPVKYDRKTIIKDVQVDYGQTWLRDHWGAIYSAYGKSPFFEYFADEIHRALTSKSKYLVDLNLDLMTFCLKSLQIDRPVRFTNSYQMSPEKGLLDLREYILPKKPYIDRDLYLPYMYTQTFGSKFVANLSLVDLLMNEGPGSSEVIKKSSKPRMNISQN